MFRCGGRARRTGSTIGTLACAALLLVGCAASRDTVVSGKFGPDNPVSLQNLTVQDGRYVVAYSLEVLFTSSAGDAILTCGVVDLTGRIAELPGLSRDVTSAKWQSVSAQADLELPDLTMGVRCYPDREVTLQVVVRDVILTAIRSD